MITRLLRPIIISTLLVWLNPIPASWAATTPANTIAPMLTQVTPTIVNITVVAAATNDDPFEQDDNPSTKKNTDKNRIGLGSGIIIDAKNGYIVTNAHVVDNAKLIVVRLKNGQRYIGHVKGIDKGFDIAVLQIHAKNLSHLTFADSDKLKVGNFVIAIGSPFGLDQTVTSGVVSALNVSAPKIEGFQSFIQTDASINPGNSGGPLINMYGKVVGINTAILGPGTNIGIGFAIPSDMVESVITQLLKYGKVERGMLGVVAQNITPQLAAALDIKQHQGTIVSEVLPGSPADKAGIKTQDIIKTVNNKPIYNAIQLRNMLGVMRPKSTLSISLYRHHKHLTLSATVGNPHEIIHEKVIPFLAGMKLHDFKELEDNGQILKGAIVVDIQPTSQAALAGVLPGDIITQAANKKITDTKDLIAVARQGLKQLLLKVKRGPMSAFVVLEKSPA